MPTQAHHFISCFSVYSQNCSTGIYTYLGFYDVRTNNNSPKVAKPGCWNAHARKHSYRPHQRHHRSTDSRLPRKECTPATPKGRSRVGRPASSRNRGGSQVGPQGASLPSHRAGDHRRRDSVVGSRQESCQLSTWSTI